MDLVLRSKKYYEDEFKLVLEFWDLFELDQTGIFDEGQGSIFLDKMITNYEIMMWLEEELELYKMIETKKYLRRDELIRFYEEFIKKSFGN